MKLRIGDTVAIIAGKDKGKTGEVLRILQTQNRVIVAGINMRTKHVKKTFQQAGQKLTYEASIHASNVSILDPKTKKISRVGYKVTEKGKIRVSKKSGEQVMKVKVTAKKKEKAVASEKKAEGTTETPASADKKSPFWKKMGFGSGMENAEVDEPSRMQQDHSVPAETQHVRAGGSRGS